MAFVDIDQHSVEWLKMRTGIVTASRMFDIVARLKRASGTSGKGDYKASRKNYMRELKSEILTGRASEKYVTEWMTKGIDDEILARAAYEAEFDVEVENGGFYLHDEIEAFGASPDGRVGENGLLELKNLKSDNHIEILEGGEIPEEYIWQMNAQLACAPEREWVDYGSYCKEILNPKWRLFVRRHYRDKQRIEELQVEVNKFNAELAYSIMELGQLRPIVQETALAE